MKKLSEKTTSLIFALIELVVGILLIVSAKKFVYAIIVGTGIALIGLAIFSIAKYFRTPPAEAAQGQLFVVGAVSCIGGIICLLKTEVIFHKFNWLVMLCGIAILLLGIIKVQRAIDIFRLNAGRWLFQAISAGLSLSLGLVVILNPFSSAKAFWTFAGIALILAFVADIVAFIANLFKKKDALEAEGNDNNNDVDTPTDSPTDITTDDVIETNNEDSNEE